MNKIDLIADSLIILGEAPISDLDDGSDVSQIINSTYPAFKYHILSAYDWTFARKQRLLARKTDTPIFGYDYIYQLPTDFFRVINVYGDSSAESTVDNYSIKADGLYTNEEKIYIDYISNVSEEDFPPYFLQFYTYAYAEKICFSLTERADRQQILQNKAYGTASEGWRGGMFAEARNIDAKQEQNQAIELYESVLVR